MAFSRIGICVIALCAALVVAAPATPAGGGNSASAKLCQDLWQTLRRADGTDFENRGACVSYAAHGGVLTTFTTSISSHTTHVRVDLTQHLFSTRVIGIATDPHDGMPVEYDQTLSVPPASQEVQAAFEAAAAAVRTFMEGVVTTGQILISSPVLLSSSETSQTTFTGEQLDHTEVTTTTTTTPMADGTVNVNTDTHTETFVDDVYETTITDLATYVITGSVAH